MDYATAQKAFGNIPSTTFVGLDTEVVVKLPGGKSNPYQGRLTKRATGANVSVYGNVHTSGYENKVKRNLAKEGKDPESFKAKPLRWGKRIPGTAFIEHEGEYFVSVIFNHPGTVEYLLDGQPIDLTVPPLGSENWLTIPQRTRNPNAQGGLSEENEIFPRAFKLASIIEARINGAVYR
jgi:hypothetical protein